jgi:hypothetical protein
VQAMARYWQVSNLFPKRPACIHNTCSDYSLKSKLNYYNKFLLKNYLKTNKSIPT